MEQNKKRRSKGDGSWGTKKINGIEYVLYKKTYNGKQKSFYGKTKKEIKGKVEEFERNNWLQTTQEIEKIILSDYMTNWLDHVKALSIKRKTYDTYKDEIKYYIKDTELGNCQMKFLSSDIILSYYKEMVDKYSMSVIKKVHSLLSMSLDYAFKRHDIKDNPMLLVDLPNKNSVRFEQNKQEIEVLSDEDIEKLFNEAQKLNTPQLRINGVPGTNVYKGINKYIIIFILYSGVRIGEMLGLKWDNWNRNNNTIEIKNNSVLVVDDSKEKQSKRIPLVYSPKTKSGIRIVPLPDRAIWALQKLQEEQEKNKIHSEFICITPNGNRPSEGTITRTLKCMIKNSGCNVNPKSFGLHDLRHTYASYHIRSGTDILVVSKLLGHKSPTTTIQIYAHVIEQQKADAIAKMN